MLARWRAGFGGTAAIVAAAIAYRAAGANGRRQQWVDRKVQWWARARWALDRALSDDGRSQSTGLDVLAALGHSEWAGEHEEDLIDAAAGRLLGPVAGTGHLARSGSPENGGRRGGPPPTDSNPEV